jgi:hypothetical protein
VVSPPSLTDDVGAPAMATPVLVRAHGARARRSAQTLTRSLGSGKMLLDDVPCIDAGRVGSAEYETLHPERECFTGASFT